MAVLMNPFTMALWGLIVAGSLAIGFLLVFAGLAVVVPVLGCSPRGWPRLLAAAAFFHAVFFLQATKRASVPCLQSGGTWRRSVATLRPVNGPLPCFIDESLELLKVVDDARGVLFLDATPCVPSGECFDLA